MSMDRQDWIVRGRSDKDAGQPPREVKPGTWQHVAYMKGYNSTGKVIRLGRGQNAHEIKAPAVAALPAIAQTMLRKWPLAAAEHYGRLYKDYQSGHNSVQRENRLLRAMMRMLKRHGTAVA